MERKRRSGIFRFLQLRLLFLLSGLFCFDAASGIYAEKLYVVQRERGALAVVENGEAVTDIKGLGNLHHATVKFSGEYAFVVTRDGFLVKIDVAKNKIVGKVRAGSSSIAFTIGDTYVAVANYEPGTVEIFDHSLKPVKTIETGSKNVGIKRWKDLFVFALMEKDEVWVVDTAKDFEVVRKISVGKLPFDAFLRDEIYIVGFYNDSAFGLLDLTSMQYSIVRMTLNEPSVVFKIPHFGLWAVVENMCFIPGLGSGRIDVVNLDDFRVEDSIALSGNPVFVKVSPSGRVAVANFSGDMEDKLVVIDVASRRILKTVDAGRRVMHFNFSEDSSELYLSSYHDNKLKVLSCTDWTIKTEINVPSPSGVFITP